MEKFAVDLTHGDESKILGVYETKEEALAAGLNFRQQYSSADGVVSCIKAKFDENNQMIGKDYIFYKAFL